MLYLDTSILVAILSKEVGSEHLDAWLGNQTKGYIAISDWVIAEFSSALSSKVRTKQISPEQRTNIVVVFRRLCDDNFQIWRVEREHFSLATRFTDQFALGLRAADALHLAICAIENGMLCTLDQQMKAAAAALRVLSYPVALR